jgi:hypothetical protein
MQRPEPVFVAIVVHPTAGNTIMTAHRCYGGAVAQVDKHAHLWEVDPGELDVNIVELPLMP